MIFTAQRTGHVLEKTCSSLPLACEPMTLFEPGRPGDLKTNYGYIRSGEATGLDSLQHRWDRYTTAGWHRPFELVLKKPQTCLDGVTTETLQEFHEVCRSGFQYIVRSHNLTPQVMWMKVQTGLEEMGCTWTTSKPFNSSSWAGLTSC